MDPEFLSLAIIDAAGTIRGEVAPNRFEIIDPGTRDHRLAMAGAFGVEVTPMPPAPPVPEAPPKYATADAAKGAAAKLIDAHYAASIADPRGILGGYDPDTAAAAARIVEGIGSDADAALIGDIAAAAGEDLAAVAAAIAGVEAQRRAAMISATGLRLRAAAAIDAEPDPHNYETIVDAIASAIASS